MSSFLSRLICSTSYLYTLTYAKQTWIRHLPESLSLYYKQTNRTTSELDGQPSSLLPSIQVSDYKATFISMHLVFLELDAYHFHLDFKLLNENKNAVIQSHSTCSY